MNTLNVHSIFRSISGEVGNFPQGSWVTFLRLAGCNLTCKFCDTEVTQDPGSGTHISIDEIVEKIGFIDKLVITGGEPLLQEQAMLLLIQSLPGGMKIQIETNGSLAPHEEIRLEPNVFWIIDYKCYGSEMTSQMPPFPEALGLFPRGSWLKFVITDAQDYAQAKTVMSRCPDLYNYAFSACTPLTHDNLFQWMLKDNIDALFNCQIHKLAKLNE